MRSPRLTRRKSARSRGSVQALAAAPRALEETGARLARAGAMWTLLEGLLHDHLDARDDAGDCIADLLDGLLANLPRTLDGPGGRALFAFTLMAVPTIPERAQAGAGTGFTATIITRATSGVS